MLVLILIVGTEATVRGAGGRDGFEVAAAVGRVIQPNPSPDGRGVEDPTTGGCASA
jgi:hypothetical protein